MISSIVLLWLLYFSSITERFFFNTVAFSQLASSVRISEQAYINSFSNIFLTPEHYPENSFLLRPKDLNLDLMDWDTIFNQYQVCNYNAPLENKNSNTVISPKVCIFHEPIKGSKSYVGNAEGDLRIGEYGQLPLLSYSYIIFSGRITSPVIEFNSPSLLLSLGRISAQKIICKNNSPVNIFSFEDINYSQIEGCTHAEIVPKLQQNQSALKKHFSSRRYLLYGILAKP